MTEDYRAPFRFTGRLVQVVVEVDGAPPAPDGEAALRAALTEQ